MQAHKTKRTNKFFIHSLLPIAIARNQEKAMTIVKSGEKEELTLAMFVQWMRYVRKEIVLPMS